MRYGSVHAMLVLLTLLAAGCGGGAGDGLSDTVRVDGSSTVYPIAEAVLEEFMAEQPRMRVTIGVSGTGGGFSRFLRGETAITNASRPVKPSERDLARQNNVEFIELPVAYDGLAVVVNPNNDWAECLMVEELRRVWEPGSEVNTWSAVRSGFPDRPLHLYGPGTNSGTYDYFTEAVVGESGASRSDFTASEDDNVLVQGIAGDGDALGFFGLAYYEENADQLKLLGIDDGNPQNGDGCIQPTAETVGDGTYQPLARPLFIYVRASEADRPAVEAFVEFFLQQAGALARDVGYVALSQEAYDLALQRFRNRTTGSLFDGTGATVGVTMEELLLREQGPEADTTEADTTAAR